SGKGPRRVEYELKIKGCDPDVAIAEAFPDGVDWEELAQEVYLRKFGSKPLGGDWNEMQRERAKRARFMAQRGFEPSQFVNLLQGSQEQADLD
ncbi:MAG: RecX family transcriptional regulator, partial [Luminiphilus sp.]|nr:RecX family transcriptional regulator [Luminiphilus sp.]